MRSAVQPAGPWFRVTPDPRAELRLICVPYAGGGASVFHPWPALIGPHVQVCAVHLPGRETRHGEPPIADLAQAVGALADACDGFLDRPFALFGHSMGGLIAFELARALRQRGRPAPVRFFASAACAPHLIARRPPFGHLDDGAFLDRLARISDEAAQVTARPEMRDVVLPVLRADVGLIETYRYADAPPFEFPITALGGTGDPWVSLGELVAWSSHTRGAFNLRLIPGGHLFIRAAGDKVVHAILETWRGASGTA